MKIKRCPFCGVKAKIKIWQKKISSNWYLVECLGKRCPISKPFTTKWVLSENKAIKAWNKRADDKN